MLTVIQLKIYICHIVDSFIFMDTNFLWIEENLCFCGYLILGFIQSLHPIENMYFIEFLILVYLYSRNS